MKNTTWKIPLIILAAIIAIALSCVFMVQGSQNHAISLEEQVGESKAAINAQEKEKTGF
jgi:LemA protein